MHLLSALVIQGAVQEVVVPALQANGLHVTCTFEPTTVLESAIRDGARGDVLVAVDTVVDALIAAGILVGPIALVETGIGVAVEAGAPQPDLSTLAGFTATLREARSVAYSRKGASGIAFAALLNRLGLAAEVNARATIIEKGLVAQALLDGRADLAIQQVSELRTVPGIQVAGPLPPEIQVTTRFSAAIFADALQRPAARDLMAALQSEAARASYVAYGLILADDAVVSPTIAERRQ